PELERHEDSDHLLAKARQAVADLKEQTKAHEALIVERERLDAERAAYIQQAEVQRRFADELDDLRNEFFALSAQKDDPQGRGRKFETFLNRLFDLFDLEPRLSYTLEREQIDGSFSFDTDDYIIEAKWTKDRVDVAGVNHFNKKVSNKGKNA